MRLEIDFEYKGIRYIFEAETLDEFNKIYKKALDIQKT